jgi:hypothetical protein
VQRVAGRQPRGPFRAPAIVFLVLGLGFSWCGAQAVATGNWDVGHDSGYGGVTLVGYVIALGGWGVVIGGVVLSLGSLVWLVALSGSRKPEARDETR